MSQSFRTSYFRPPAATFDMFNDLAESDDESSMSDASEAPDRRERSVLGSHQRSREATSLVRQPQDYLRSEDYFRDLIRSQPQTSSPREPLALSSPLSNASSGPSNSPHSVPGTTSAAPVPSYRNLHPVNPPPILSIYRDQTAKKKATQIERVSDAEKDIQLFLEEHPGNDKFRAKLLQLRAYREKLDGGKLLTSGEVEWVRRIFRSIDRQRVTLQTKAFTAKVQSETSHSRCESTDSVGERGRMNGPPQHHSHALHSSSLSSPRHLTTGGKTITRELLNEITPSKRLVTPEPEQQLVDGSRHQYGGKRPLSPASYSFSFAMDRSESIFGNEFTSGQTAPDEPMSDDSASETEHSDTDSEMEDAESEEVSASEGEEEEEEEGEEAEEYETYWQYKVVQLDSRPYTPETNFRKILGIFTDKEKAMERVSERMEELKVNNMWGAFGHVVPLSNADGSRYGEIIESPACGSVEVSVEKEWVQQKVSERHTQSATMVKKSQPPPRSVFIVLVQQKDLKTGTLIKSDVHPKSFLSLNDANRHAAQVWKLASMSEEEIRRENLSDGTIFDSPFKFAPGYLGELEANGKLFHKDFFIFKGDERIQVTISVQELEIVHPD
jgi:hypothetical protein